MLQAESTCYCAAFWCLCKSSSGWKCLNGHCSELIGHVGKCTQTGKAILKLQMHLPDAKVLYSSATGASEPNNLAYMVRLSACGFESMKDLVRELNE